jgi:DNA-binding transcriptional regulator/RsmH inhibitor MraZ
VTGAFDHIEIWDAARWATTKQDGEGEFGGTGM